MTGLKIGGDLIETDHSIDRSAALFDLLRKARQKNNFKQYLRNNHN